MNKFAPPRKGLFYLPQISVNEIIPFINWRFFFLAWQLSGNYSGIEAAGTSEACRQKWLQNFDSEKSTKANEALKLYKDTQTMLQKVLSKKTININAVVGLFDAYSSENEILIVDEEKSVHCIPTLRQQHPGTDGLCYSLADFIDKASDYIGIFAVTVHNLEKFEYDIYSSMLVKTLADRLAEATTEWLHWKVRTELWAYASTENLSVESMLKSKYQGIRPAIGYPSLPDQSVIFDFDKLIHYEKIGIRLTENGVMFPNASVSGLMFSHPKSHYFMVGKIGEDQLACYAQKRGKTMSEMRKWLINNL